MRKSNTQVGALEPQNYCCEENVRCLVEKEKERVQKERTDANTRTKVKRKKKAKKKRAKYIFVPRSMIENIQNQS